MNYSDLRIAWGGEYSPAEWAAAPRYRQVRARIINARWAAHSEDTAPWTLTHRATGFATGRVRTFQIAQRLARALDRKFGAKAWDFTDPEIARGRKGAKLIVAKHEAMTR